MAPAVTATPVSAPTQIRSNHSPVRECSSLVPRCPKRLVQPDRSHDTPRSRRLVVSHGLGATVDAELSSAVRQVLGRIGMPHPGATGKLSFCREVKAWASLPKRVTMQDSACGSSACDDSFRFSF